MASRRRLVAAALLLSSGMPDERARAILGVLSPVVRGRAKSSCEHIVACTNVFLAQGLRMAHASNSCLCVHVHHLWHTAEGFSQETQCL